MISIFDIGRTNKKFLLFDQDYKVAEETAIAIPDITDEDGDACEDLQAISAWMKEQLQWALNDKKYDIQAINFSAHGASFVHIDTEGNPVTPLYDYMKRLPVSVTEEFYQLFGGEEEFSIATGSPVLKMLNSGIQLFWLKKSKPELFEKANTSLHLPQYGNFLFSGKKHADLTSIGCHTGLWDFRDQQYHSWIKAEKVSHLLPEPEGYDTHDFVQFGNKIIAVGIGMHDSSAALLPFVKTAKEPFVLLSTGTWNVSLNPFYKGQLEEEKYQKDCLYFLLGNRQKVAASRLFLGNEYDFQIRKLEKYFHKDGRYHQQIHPDKSIIEDILKKQSTNRTFFPEAMQGTGPYPGLEGTAPNLAQFETYEEAYHQMMLDLTYLQKISIELISGSIKRLYVSGGFHRNKVFMELLQAFLPEWQICIAENKRSAALGAAVALHEVWQMEPLPESVSPVVIFDKQLDLDLQSYLVPDYTTATAK